MKHEETRGNIVFGSDVASRRPVGSRATVASQDDVFSISNSSTMVGSGGGGGNAAAGATVATDSTDGSLLTQSPQDEKDAKSAKMLRMLNSNSHLRIVPELIMMLLMMIEKKKKEEEAKLKGTVHEVQNELARDMQKKMQLLTESLSKKLINGQEQQEEEGEKSADDMSLSELMNTVFGKHISNMLSAKSQFVETSKKSVQNLMKNQSKKIMERMAVESELLMWAEGRRSDDSTIDARLDEILAVEQENGNDASTGSRPSTQESMSNVSLSSRFDRLASLAKSDSTLNELLRYRQDLALKDISSKLSVIQKEEEALMESGTEHVDTSSICLQEAKDLVKNFIDNLAIQTGASFQMSAAFQLSYQTVLQNLDKMTDMNKKLTEQMRDREKAIGLKNNLLLKIIKREEVISHKIQQEVLLVQRQYEAYVAEMKREERRREMEMMRRYEIELRNMEALSASAPSVISIEPRTKVITGPINDNHERERQFLLYIIQEKEEKILQLKDKLNKSSYHINRATTLVRHKKTHFVNEARRGTMQIDSFQPDDRPFHGDGVSHQDAIEHFLEKKNSTQDDKVYSVSTLFQRIDILKTENTQLRSKIIDLQQNFISYMEQIQARDNSAQEELEKERERARKSAAFKSVHHSATQTTPRKEETSSEAFSSTKTNSIDTSRSDSTVAAPKGEGKQETEYSEEYAPAISETGKNQQRYRIERTEGKAKVSTTNSENKLRSSKQFDKDGIASELQASSDKSDTESVVADSAELGVDPLISSTNTVETEGDDPLPSKASKADTQRIQTKKEIDAASMGKVLSPFRSFIQSLCKFDISADFVRFFRTLNTYLQAMNENVVSMNTIEMKRHFSWLRSFPPDISNTIQSSEKAIHTLVLRERQARRAPATKNEGVTTSVVKKKASGDSTKNSQSGTTQYIRGRDESPDPTARSSNDEPTTTIASDTMDALPTVSTLYTKKSELSEGSHLKKPLIQPIKRSSKNDDKDAGKVPNRTQSKKTVSYDPKLQTPMNEQKKEDRTVDRRLTVPPTDGHSTSPKFLSDKMSSDRKSDQSDAINTTGAQDKSLGDQSIVHDVEPSKNVPVVNTNDTAQKAHPHTRDHPKTHLLQQFEGQKSPVENLIDYSEMSGDVKHATDEEDYRVKYRSTDKESTGVLTVRKKQRQQQARETTDEESRFREMKSAEIYHTSIEDVIQRLTDPAQQDRWNRKKEQLLLEQEEKLMKMLEQYMESDDTFSMQQNRVGQRKLYAIRSQSPDKLPERPRFILLSTQVLDLPDSLQEPSQENVDQDDVPNRKDWFRKTQSTQSNLWDHVDSRDYTSIVLGKKHPPVLIGQETSEKTTEVFRIPKGFFKRTPSRSVYIDPTASALSIQGSQTNLLDQTEHDLPIEKSESSTTKLPPIFRTSGGGGASNESEVRRAVKRVDIDHAIDGLDVLFRSASAPLEKTSL